MDPTIIGAGIIDRISCGIIRIDEAMIRLGMQQRVPPAGMPRCFGTGEIPDRY